MTEETSTVTGETTETTNSNSVATVQDFDKDGAISRLADLGYKVYPETFTYTVDGHKDDAFIDGIESKAIDGYSHKTKARYEKDIKDVSGLDKIKPTEPTHDYMKRVIGTLKQQVEALTKEVPDIDTLKQLHQTERENDRKGFNALLFNERLNSDVDKLVPEDLSSTDANQRQTDIRNLIRNAGKSLAYRFDEDGILYLQKDGDDMLDKNGKPVTIGAYLSQQYGALLKKTDVTPTGTGTRPKPANPATAVPTTEADLIKIVEDSGISSLTNPKGFAEKMRQLSVEYGVKLSGRAPVTA